MNTPIDVASSKLDDGIYMTAKGRVQKVKGKLIFDDELRETIKKYINQGDCRLTLFCSGATCFQEKIYVITAHIPNSDKWIDKQEFVDNIVDAKEKQQFQQIVLPDREKVWIAYRDILKCGTMIGRAFGYDKHEFNL